MVEEYAKYAGFQFSVGRSTNYDDKYNGSTPYILQRNKTIQKQDGQRLFDISVMGTRRKKLLPMENELSCQVPSLLYHVLLHALILFTVLLTTKLPAIASSHAMLST